MTVKAYRFCATTDKLNELAKQNWKVYSQNPFIVGIDFDMKDGEHLNNYRKAMEDAANFDQETRDVLIDAGFKILKLDDGYVLDDDSPIYRWTLQFCVSDEDGLAYITNQNPHLGFPLIAIKSEIDKYVPKSILKPAVDCGALVECEVEVKQPEPQPKKRNEA